MATNSEAVRKAAIAEMARRELARRQAQPKRGNVVDAIGQGTFLGFSDELAGLAGAAIGTFDPNMEGTTFGERYRGIRDVARENVGGFRERNPKTALAAEIGGGLLTGGVGASGVTGAGQIIARGGLLGGVYGAGSSESETTTDVAADALKGAAVGAVASAAFPLVSGAARGTGRLLTQPNRSSTYQNAVKLLEKAGVKLTSGQKTGSKAVRVTESTLSDTLLGGSVRSATDRGREQLQKRILSMAGFGDDATALTREALDEAQNRFAKRYTEALGKATVRLDSDEFLSRLDDVQRAHNQFLPVQQKAQVNEIIDDLLDEAAKGPISGEKYQAIRSLLARNQRSNTPFSNLYGDLKKALDAAFTDAAGTVEGASKKTLDMQYARFKALQKTFEGSGGAQASEGFVPLARLAGIASRNTDREFEQIARAGSMVLGEVAGNSGTAQRAINTAMLGGLPAVAGGVDAGLVSMGAPLAASYLMGRGVTGSHALDALARTGVLAAPASVPIARRNSLLFTE